MQLPIGRGALCSKGSVVAGDMEGVVAVTYDLLDSVYRAALEPAAWMDVMQQLAQCFPSSAQAFCHLRRNPRRYS